MRNLNISTGAVLSALLLVSPSTAGANDPADKAPALSLSGDELSVLTKNLNDPGSATVRNVRSAKLTGVVCGEINWKNEQGGYGGYQAFWLDTAEKQAAITPHPSYYAFASPLGCAD